MRSLAPWITALPIFAALLGCAPQHHEPPPPATYPVEGKVLQRNGKAFTTGGLIDFRHDTNPAIRTTGEIKPDGSFALHSISGSQKVAGAQEGPHTVTISPASQEQNVKAIQLKKKVHIKAGDNHLVIEIDD